MEQNKKRGKRGPYKPKPSSWSARSSVYVAHCLEKARSEEHGSKCIELPLKLNQDGYLRVHVGNKCRMLHQMIWEAMHGKVPDGYEVHHLCKNRSCQNINHLDCIEGSRHATISNLERAFRIGEWRKEKALDNHEEKV